MSVIKIQQANYQQEVTDSKEVVLLDFWSPTCSPCRMLNPILEDFAAENPQIKVGKINVDEEPELAKQFRVMSIPSLFVMKGGNVIRKAVGVRSKQQLLTMVQEAETEN